MNIRSLIISFVPALLLAACAHSPGRFAVLDPDIIEAARHYAADEDRLQAGVTAELAALKNRRWELERRIIGAAVRHEQEQRWREADRAFAAGLKHLPDSQILRAARKQLHERRLAREQFARAELLINQGEQLLKDERAYTQISQLKPANMFTRMEISGYRHEREKTAAKLMQYAQMASQRHDYALARRCLMVADQLNSTETSKEALLALNTRDAKNRSASRRQGSRSLQHSRAFQLELERYHKALANDDLLAARKQLNNLLRRYPASGELQSLQSDLQSLIGTKISSTVERGKLLYSQGEVQQALQLWQGVLPLDPDNAVLKHNIQRAQRVLENIKTLREQQSG